MLLSLKVAHIADTPSSIKVSQDYGGPFMATQGNKNYTSWSLRGKVSPAERLEDKVILEKVHHWQIRACRGASDSELSEWVKNNLFPYQVTCRGLNSLAYFTSLGLQIQLSADINLAPAVHLLVNPFATFIFGIPGLLYLKALPLN